MWVNRFCRFLEFSGKIFLKIFSNLWSCWNRFWVLLRLICICLLWEFCIFIVVNRRFLFLSAYNLHVRLNTECQRQILICKTTNHIMFKDCLITWPDRSKFVYALDACLIKLQLGYQCWTLSARQKYTVSHQWEKFSFVKQSRFSTLSLKINLQRLIWLTKLRPQKSPKYIIVNRITVNKYKI